VAIVNFDEAGIGERPYRKRVVAQTIFMLVVLAGSIIGAIVACAAMIALVLSFVSTDKGRAAKVS